MQSCPWSTHGHASSRPRFVASDGRTPTPAAPAIRGVRGASWGRSFLLPVCGGAGGDGDGDVRGGDFSGPVCGHGSARGDPVDDGLPGRSA
jgi:hypothetical protein